MRSSISNSERRASGGVETRARKGISRASWALLLLLAMMLVGAELATRYVIAPRSAIQRRIHAEYMAARSLGAGDALFVGNSLLLWGVDEPSLQAGMRPEWNAHRLVLESTTFEDWKFGLKKLFDEGSKPGAVFVVLSTAQFTQNSVLGDHFANQLLAMRDLPAVAKELDLHPTAVTSMALANRSRFYGLRGELRKALMFALLPGLDKLFALINRGGQSIEDETTAQRNIADHLADLREFGRLHGTRVVLVIPPALSGAGQMERIVELGKRYSVPVIVPITAGVLDRDFFSDGFHLNAKGQRVFVPALTAEAKKALQTTASE